jgi:hypothetical protein
MFSPLERASARPHCLGVFAAAVLLPGCGLNATIGATVPPPPQAQIVVAAPAPPPPPPAPPPPPQAEVVVAAPAPPPPAVVVVGAPVAPMGVTVTISPGIAIVSHLPIGFDMVGAGDQAVHPDGQPEGTFAASLEGPIDGLILVTTDAAGAPCCGQQWDTIVGQDPLPHIGSGFDGAGSSTWILGVLEKNHLVNDATGRVLLGPGKHGVLLGGSPSGFFKPGQHFRLLVHHPGAPEWNGGPVFLW